MQDRDLLLRLARFEGASLDPEIDWVKHRSAVSVLVPREDYLRALAALLAKHRAIIEDQRELVVYLVARTLLADFLQGDWRSLFAGIQKNREIQQFGFPYANYLEDTP